jgi:hypothetical protein
MNGGANGGARKIIPRPVKQLPLLPGESAEEYESGVAESKTR